MIVTHKTKGNPDVHFFNLTVEQTGMTLTVKAGSFKMSGEDHTLTEDSEHTVLAGKCTLGYLVKHKVSGDISVVVEETDDEDTEVYNWKQGEYDLLFSIFNVTTPVDAVTLDDVQINVYEIYDPEG